MAELAIPTGRSREQVSAEIERIIVETYGARGFKRFTPTTVQAFAMEWSGPTVILSALANPLIFLRALSNGKKPRFNAEYRVGLTLEGVLVTSKGPHVRAQYELLLTLLEQARERGEFNDELYEVERTRLTTETPERE